MDELRADSEIRRLSERILESADIQEGEAEHAVNVRGLHQLVTDGYLQAASDDVARECTRALMVGQAVMPLSPPLFAVSGFAQRTATTSPFGSRFTIVALRTGSRPPTRRARSTERDRRRAAGSPIRG